MNNHACKTFAKKFLSHVREHFKEVSSMPYFKKSNRDRWGFRRKTHRCKQLVQYLKLMQNLLMQYQHYKDNLNKSVMSSKRSSAKLSWRSKSQKSHKKTNKKEKWTRHIRLTRENKQNLPSRFLSLQNQQKSIWVPIKIREAVLNSKCHNSSGR